MPKIDNHYLNRITPQHKTKPKFMKWLTAQLDILEDSKMFYQSIDPAFDLDTAVGAQLDTNGYVAGVDRLLSFEPVYASPLLSDDYYRMVIKAKISLNQWDGTIQGIKDMWNDIFGEYRLDVIDHQDMTMTLRIRNLTNMFEAEFISRGYLAPKPSTVRVRYEFSMQWEASENLYYCTGLLDERITRWLGDLRGQDAAAETEIYAGGLPAAQRIKQILEDLNLLPKHLVGGVYATGVAVADYTRTYLTDSGKAESLVFSKEAFAAGSAVYETKTEYLEGGS